MELIPAYTAAVLAPALSPADRDRLLRTCAGSGRQLGVRVELDLDLVRARGEHAMADVLARYHEICVGFWERERTGQRLGPCITVRRVLREAQQRDNAGGRSDLGAEYEALREVAGVGELLEALTEPVPDPATLERLGSPLMLDLELGEGSATAHITVDARCAWPVVLGGAGSPGEVRRRLTLCTSYAKWRDRRVRRLVQLTVETEELWPEPRLALVRERVTA